MPAAGENAGASEVATLGGGCFWCLEAVFDGLQGVRSVESGYSGGHIRNPTYEDICGGDTGHAEEPKLLAERLARLAAASVMDGVVCSAQEAQRLRQACGPEFCLVTPGIRLADAAQDDQKRIVTPQTAIANGSDYLVIGRPITRAADPLAVLDRINADIGG